MKNLNQPIKFSKIKKPFNLALIIVGLVLLVLIIVLVIKVLGQSQKINKLETNDYQETQALKHYLQTTYTEEQRQAIEGQDNYYLGAPQPLVTIVEFADFACSHCRESYSVVRELALEYPTEIKIIWRDRPAFDYSLNLAQAAYCAGEQDKFWPMHDKLFRYQTATLGANSQDLSNLAQQAGVNIQQFNQCLLENRYLEKIKTNYLAAEALGLSGTPTWFVNGQKIEGHLPKSDWQEMIEKLIN